jgi:hypothetical protein
MNSVVMKGYRDKAETVGQLPDPGIPLTDLSEDSHFLEFRSNVKIDPKAGFREIDSGTGWQKFEKFLDRQKIEYVLFPVIEPIPSLATIVTRHETYARKIRNANKVCICDRPKNPHDGPSHKEGDPCDFCEYHYICR